MFRLWCAGNWPNGSVVIQRTACGRRIVPEVETAIESAWATALARPGVQLFDGPMCRLESWQNTPSELTLTLSISSYKTFLGTNMSHPEFADTHGSAVMGNPVGLSIPLSTADGLLLLGFRSAAVAYYPGRVHPFAGNLEPDDADVFTAALRELQEELGIATEDVTRIRCIGVAEDHALRQPELIFSAASRLTLAQIESRLDPTEHTAIWSIPANADDVTTAIDNDPRLTPIAAASLELWKKRSGKFSS